MDFFIAEFTKYRIITKRINQKICPYLYLLHTFFLVSCSTIATVEKNFLVVHKCGQKYQLKLAA